MLRREGGVGGAGARPGHREGAGRPPGLAPSRVETPLRLQPHGAPHPHGGGFPSGFGCRGAGWPP